MDTGWIQVFVLTLAECVAPPGKTVCQQQEFELTFLTESDCELALEQLVTLKDAAENIIIDKARTGCVVTARPQTVFDSPSDVSASVDDTNAWRAPDVSATTEQVPATVDAEYQERLKLLPECDASNGVPPCKIGQIIIEEDPGGEPVKVWRRDDK